MIDNQKDNLESLKDSTNTGGMAITDKSSNIPYNKANKLITALFMVTDILDKNEPIRAKLRALGMDIISDMYTAPAQAQAKIGQILSFLDIASTISMISEMNANILKKEFINLNKSVNESTLQGSSLWLEKFMSQQPAVESAPVAPVSNIQITKMNEVINPYQGHKTRIGVQKASTLLKALSGATLQGRTMNDSDKPVVLNTNKQTHSENKENFDMLKKQRREEIIKVIKENKEALERGGSTITDIRNGAKIFANSLGIKALLSCSEKTLQRELVSMVKDNILKKTGEKRWSKYFI